jgi:hypothetical protein
MKIFRIILGILAIIPVSFIVVAIADPKLVRHNPSLEWEFLLIGVPILVLNLWAWDAPGMVKKMFGMKHEG